MTPEGKVKAKVKKLLKKYDHWGWWPVPGGYGKGALDYIGCCGGKFFAIETKAEGKKLTPLQERDKQAMEWAGGKVFVIMGLQDPAFEELEHWLSTHEQYPR